MTEELFGPVMEEIKRRMEGSETADEFKKSLFENLNQYDTEDLAEILRQCLLVGNMAGRSEVLTEMHEVEPVQLSALKAKISFTNLPFEEAIKHLRGLTVMTGVQYYELEQVAQAKAFSIARQSNLDLLNGVKDSLTEALEQGQTFSEWRENLDAVFEKYGVKKVNDQRADLIFRQNTQTAYQAGRYQQQTDPDVLASQPYWMYSAVHDGRTRPAHRAMDGLCFPASHVFWKTHYPPNGFRCRCKVIALSEAQAVARGIKVMKRLPKERLDPRTGEMVHDLRPDAGFDGNPAQMWAA